jgi:hypothetical protein
MASLLKPLSSVHVPETRKDLKSIPHNMISYESYGDIWGESTPPRAPKAKFTRRWTAEPNSIARSAAAARLAQVTPGVSGTEKVTERWDEETQGSEEIAFPSAAMPDEPDHQSPVTQVVSPPPKLKRQKSNDRLPVIPNRRVSTEDTTNSTGMFSGFHRRASYEYAELSRRGIAISMQKQQATGKQSDEVVQSMAALSIPDLPANEP